jgi:hypothetical protein
MARVFVSTGVLPVLYAIDQAVGSGCPNRRDDVLLVQFLLKVVSEGPKKDKYTPPGRGPIQCDGAWGPISQAYLNQYIAANSASNPNSPLTKDGRVDPVVAGNFTGSRTGNLYTIVALNHSYKNTRGASALTDITADAVFPADLRPSIKVG